MRQVEHLASIIQTIFPSAAATGLFSFEIFVPSPTGPRDVTQENCFFEI